ncbi:MAG: transporter substrate-binding domain-containing protein [Gammaproteobacteria bacterium]|nr:transporter substrate-binding domain-containing protein [Gammaproteobacteria bacterium]
MTLIHVQLNWHHQYQFGGFYAALQQGYYRQAGLDVHLHHFQAEKNVLAEVLEGRAQFGIGYSTTIADYIKGAPIQLVLASFQHSPMVLLTHEPIGDLSELIGKTGMYSDSMQVLSLLNKATKQKKDSIQKRYANTNLNEFVSKNVDFYGAYITNEPFQLQELGIPYHIVDPKLYGVNSAEDLVFTTKAFANANPAIVAAFREATIKGWQFAIENPDTVIDFMLAHYSVPKSRRALFYEAKALTSYVSVGTRPIGVVEPARLKDTALELKEIGLINQAQFDAFEPERFMGMTKGKVSLSASELDYLAKNPTIKLANDIDWAPFEFVDNEGFYQGVSADYFRLFEEKLGVKFEHEKSRSWSQVVEDAIAGKLLIYSCASPTPERQKYMHFTDPYISFPMVLIARNDVNYIDNFNLLNGQTVAVVKDYWSHEYLKTQFPKINLLVVDSVKEALTAVVTGKAIAYSDNLAVANHYIRQYGMSGLTFVGESQEKFEMAIGVHQSDPILFSIMQKALASVSEDEKRVIYDRWIHIELIKRLDKKQLWELSGYAFSIIALLFITLLVYRYQRNRFQHYINQINELNFASKIELATEKVVWVSQSYAALRGCEVGDLIGQRYTEFASDRVSQEAIQAIKQQLIAGKTWIGEVEGKRCNGEHYWVKLTLTPEKNWLGKITHVWATRVDITDKKRIEVLSNTDELTKLYNRHYFNKTLPSLQQQYQGSGKHLCLASIDIDYFKLINDTYGHLVGDRVLQQVADYLKACCTEEGAMAFRLGGEEFMLVAFVADVDDFYQQLERLRQQILAAKIENRDAPLGYLSISIGACCWPDGQPSDWDALYRQVDDLLYQAKQSGRNQLVLTN